MIPKLHSLRLRFMVSILLWTALGIGAIWYSSTRLFEMHVEEQYHDELDVHIRELDGLTKLKADGQPYLSRPLSDPRFAVPNAGFYWQITREGYEPLKSSSITTGGFDDRVAKSDQVTHGHQLGPTGKAITYGLIRRTEKGDNIRFVIATDQRLLDAVTNAFEAELKIWLSMLALLLLASGGVIIVFGLRPLDKLRDETTALRRGEAQAIEGNYPREIAPLVDNLNAYISSNMDLVAKARVQAGNLAHALRTPLAVMTDEAERMIEGRKSAASAETFLEQCGVMTQQVEYQLARARSTAANKATFQPADFSLVAAPVLSAMKRLHPDKNFRLTNHNPMQLKIGIDPNDLAEILGCLFDNAGKWADCNIDCIAEIDTKNATISICDDGPGIAAGNIPKAFEVGMRFDPVVSGTGLGLAIARDLTLSAKGKLALTSGGGNRSGLCARLVLPIADSVL